MKQKKLPRSNSATKREQRYKRAYFNKRALHSIPEVKVRDAFGNILIYSDKF